MDEILAGTERAYLLATRFCPLHCGASFLGKDMAHHVEHCCPRRITVCLEGCGEHVVGADVDSHRASCSMAVLLDRAEAAIRENALRELRLAFEGIYQERELARARLIVHGKLPQHRGWASARCEARVKKCESARLDLTVRLRKKAKDRLMYALAQCAAEANPQASVGGAKSALKFWDTIGATEVEVRGARPWDLQSPVLPLLIQTLDEARVCGADEQLRRRAERTLIEMVRRILEVALVTVENQTRALSEGLEHASTMLRLVELEDMGELPKLMQELQGELHKATLREMPTCDEKFFDAIRNGDVELARWFIDRERANPSAVDPDSGLPVLVLAAKAGDLPMCRLLVGQRADVDARCEADGCSALHWAAHMRAARTLAVLLEGRANPRLQDKHGQDALMKLLRRDIAGPAPGCAWSWEVQQSQRLPGPALPISDVVDIETAQVTGEAEPKCVGFSLHSGGSLSFHAAAPPPAPPRQELPAEAGESNDERGGEEEEEADESLWISYLKVATDPAHDIQALLTAGADPCAGDTGGLTPLHHHFLSSQKGGSVVAVRAMLKGGADVNQRDRTARSTTPFLLAVSAKRADMVQMMIKEAWPPADVDSKTADGTTALALAESLKARSVAKLLHDAGACMWETAEIRLGAGTTFSFDSRVAPARA